MQYPTISIIIPTFNSAKVLPIIFSGIKNQIYPKKNIEVIIADNGSNDETIGLANKFGAKVITVQGKPPQVCKQRNNGIMKAMNEYVMPLDHDMELSPTLLKHFAQVSKRYNNSIDAYFVPEKIIASSRILSALRTFERSFYSGTVIDAVRIIKKKTFLRAPEKYDPALSGGPADWDLDIQLKKIGAKFAVLSNPIYHHEERLSFWKYISRKSIYGEGIKIYIRKWRRDKKIFDEVVSKQFGVYYRSIGVFIENGKWRMLLSSFPLYILFLGMKFLMVLLFFINVRKQRS